MVNSTWIQEFLSILDKYEDGDFESDEDLIEALKNLSKKADLAENAPLEEQEWRDRFLVQLRKNGDSRSFQKRFSSLLSIADEMRAGDEDYFADESDEEPGWDSDWADG